MACSKGTVFMGNNTCMECPRGSYQDEDGKNSCKSCPDATFTQFVGAQNVGTCQSNLFLFFNLFLRCLWKWNV